jgi:hypothetical protein
LFRLSATESELQNIKHLGELTFLMVEFGLVLLTSPRFILNHRKDRLYKPTILNVHPPIKHIQPCHSKVFDGFFIHAWIVLNDA